MSGVFGCWHFDDRPASVAALRVCLERISPAGPVDVGVWHSGAVALGSKPAHDGGDFERDVNRLGVASIACVFDGRLDNREELYEALHRLSPLREDCPDRVLVRAAYEEYGESFVDRLRGDFVCSVFDRRANRLLLARDRLGVRPLCFTRVQDTFLFATEAKALLSWPGVTAVPDAAMMADFALQFLSVDSQKRTFFRDIHSVPPSHLLIVTPEKSTLRRYFEFDTERSVRLPAFRDYVGAFHQLVIASVRNRLRHRAPVGISVSGGLDSAYIFCIAQRLVRDGAAPCPRVLGFNYAGAPGTPSEEEDFVRAIERSCEATIERIPQRPGFMAAARDEVWHSESALIEGLACQRQAMYRRVRETGAGRLLTGHWGDQVLSDADYLIDLCRSRRWRAVTQHSREWGIGRRRLAKKLARDFASRYLPAAAGRAVRRLRPRHDSAWLSPWYTDRFRRLLRERFEDARLTRVKGTSHAWAIYQQSRRGYHVQCMEWNSRLAAMHGLDVAFPYLDSDLLQFLMAIPGEAQSPDGVPRGLMREAMRGLVPDAVVNRRTKGEFTHLANRSIEIDFAQIADILGPSSLLVQFGYVNGAVLWRHLGEWRTAIRVADTATLANRLIELCGMELLLRQFTGAEALTTSDVMPVSVS